MSSRFKPTANYHGTGIAAIANQSTGELLTAFAPVFYKNDFQTIASDATNDVAEAVEGTSNAIDIQVLTNGYIRINTGTAVDKRNCISGELVYEAENELIWQCKLHTTTSDAALLLFAGLNDSKDEGTGKVPLVDGSLAAGTIDANADDLVGFGVRAETSDNIYAVGCAGAETPQSTDTGTDLVLGTDYIFECDLNSRGDCQYWLNGDYICTHDRAVTPTDPLTWYVGGLITAGSTAALIDVDYVIVAQNRS